MTRDQVIRLAKRIALDADKAAPAGSRIVVIVTPEDGEFVGVAANTPGPDVREILRCALAGDERIDHRDVIEMPPEPRGALHE